MSKTTTEEPQVLTVYYVCDSCAHVQPHPADIDDGPDRCENCDNWSLSGPFQDLDQAEEISQVRLDYRNA